MSQSTFSEGIKKLSKNNVVATIGDEPFLRDQIKAKVIQDNKDCEVIRLDANELDEKDILNEISFKDLFSTKRIFLIKNFVKIKKLDFFLDKKFNDIIILDSKNNGKSKYFKELEKKILFIDCSKPKPWLQEKDATNRIKAYLNRSGFIIHDDVAQHMYSHLGYNLYRIVKEIQKILMYKEGSDTKNITKKDIDTICVTNLNYNIFDIIDKIINRDKKEALDLMNRLFKNESSPAILLISLWYTHFESLLLCKNRRDNEAELFKCIKMPPTVVKNKLIPQSKKLPLNKIIESMDYLAKADLNLRKGSFNLKFYLDKFVIDF